MISALLITAGISGLVVAWRRLTINRDLGRALVFGGAGTAAVGYAIFGIVGIAGAVAPAAVLRFIESRRRSRLERSKRNCTPEALEALADAIRAKGSLRLGVAELSRSGPAPTRRAFEMVQARLESGVDLQSAIGVLASELKSDEAREAVLAMRLHLASGGNLAQSLELVAERARDGLSVERELVAMTAQGRLSGIVMALAAPGFALVTHSIGLGGGFLIHTPVGIAVLVVGLCLDACGYLWMRNICEVRW